MIGVSLWRSLNLTVTAVRPFSWMVHYPGANHVQVDVDQTAIQMLVGLDGGSMIAVFPNAPCRFLR
jgi:hypothetical protein